MRSGQLNRYVTILKPPEITSENTDAMGQLVGQWQEVGKRWAEIRDLTGNRLFAAQQVHPEIRTEVRFRYTTDITAGMKIQHGSRLLEILGHPADPDGRRIDLVCTCREI